MTEVPVSSSLEDEGGAYPRARWANRKDFLFTAAGQMINYRSFCVLPFMVYSFGGSAFFIPYGLTLFFITFPLLVLEMGVGQYTSRTGAAAWRMICPMFHGVGFASQFFQVYLNLYYMLIPTRAIYYLYSSFYSPLPWTRCDGWYNSDSCLNDWPVENNDYDTETETNSSSYFDYDTTAEHEFFHRNVLRTLEDVSWNDLNASMVPCLLIVWIMTYFCVWKGAKYLGKVFYVTVPLSCLLLFIILIRGLTAENMQEGIKIFFMPHLGSVLESITWIAAASHAFYTYSLCIGVFTSLGSYNHYNSDYYRDCLLLIGLHLVTCIVMCLAVSSIMGFLASSLNKEVAYVMSSDFLFIFATLPKALSLLPASNVWAVIYFLLLLLLSMNSQLVHADSLVTVIIDLFPKQLRRPHRRELLLLAMTVVCFLLGLLLFTKRGENLFIVLDNYGLNFATLLFIAIFESISVAWIYGADRFYRNMEDMLGYKVFPVLKYCWLFIIPLVCVVFLQILLLQSFGIYLIENPAVYGTLSLILMTLPLMSVPVGIFVALCKNRDAMTTPSSDLRQSGPHLPVLTLCKRVIRRAATQPGRKDEEEGENLTMDAVPGKD